MKNWMTTASGLLAAIGAALAQMDDPTIKAVGAILAAVGTILLGASAKQFNVTGGTILQPTPPDVKAADIEQAKN